MQNFDCKWQREAKSPVCRWHIGLGRPRHGTARHVCPKLQAVMQAAV